MITDINRRIYELGEYFKEALIKGNYDIKGEDRYTIHITIDNNKFEIWYDKDRFETLKFYSGGLSLKKFAQGTKLTMYERREAHSLLTKRMEVKQSDIVAAKIKKLQADIERLKSTGL